MKFEKSAKKAGINSLIIGCILLVIASLLQYFSFNQQPPPLFIVATFWLIILIISWLFFEQGVSLIKSGGKWVIIINQDVISWSSPNESLDKSFIFEISKIEKTETRIRRNDHDPDDKSHYVLLKNGNEQELNSISGVNLDQVLTELENLGIKNESFYI